MRRYTLLLCCLCAALTATGAVGAADLSSDSLLVTVRDGSIVGLTNRLTGERLVSPGKAGSSELHMIGGKGLSMSAGGSAVQMSNVGAIEHSASGEGGKELRAHFERDSSDIIVTQSGRSDSTGVYGISWAIGDIPNSFEVLVPGRSGLRFGSNTPSGTHSFIYPYEWEAQFVIIQGKAGGMIIRAEDASYRFKRLTIEHADGCSRLRFETHNAAPFGDKSEIESVRWRISAYRGSWQTGAAVYRNWAERTYGLTPLDRQKPEWVKDIQFVVTMGMSMPTLDLLARHVNPEQTLLYIPDWRNDAYDRNYPDYTAAPDFGPFMEKAHELGFRVMAHVNYFGCHAEHPIYEQVGKYHLRDPFSGELQWWYWPRTDPPIKFAYINPASTEWRRIFTARMVELCTRYGVDALHLDQTLLVINDANGLIDGLTSAEGNILLHRELREALPEVALSGEGLNELTCRYEAFAQRHVTGIEFVEGTWNDALLSMAHPISSAVLRPYTAMYGYLGLPNPDFSPDTHTAWRRAYEKMGIIPTLAWPSSSQLTDPPDSISAVLREARFFQNHRPSPDFTSTWDENDLFLYRLSDGVQAFHGRDRGVVFGTRSEGERTILSRRLEGMSEVSISGSIPGWPAYDNKRIFGLDPGRSYNWSPRSRNLKTLHISSLPEGLSLTQVGMHHEFARFRLEDVDQGIRLWTFAGEVHSGVEMPDGTIHRTAGTTFSHSDSGADTCPEGDGLFAHPPWKSTGNEQVQYGVTFIEFSLTLPDADILEFRSDVCLRPLAVGQSDGVTFRLSASSGGSNLSSEVHHAGADPIPLVLDISGFRGKKAVLRLETHPGPNGDTNFDWARFVKPSVIVGSDTRRSVEIFSRKPISPVTADGDVQIEQIAENTYRLDLALPNTIVMPFRDAIPVSRTTSLLDLPFSNHILLHDGMEKPPVMYSHASIATAVCGGIKRRSLHEHPPHMGKTLVDYWLSLSDEPLRLVTAIGLRDGSTSNGVGFEVEVNGRQVFKDSLRPDSGWVPVEVDLTPWAGQSVLLTLITDSLGDNGFDWSVWAEPRLVAADGR